MPSYDDICKILRLYFEKNGVLITIVTALALQLALLTCRSNSRISLLVIKFCRQESYVTALNLNIKNVICERLLILKPL
jgi:hypothetical protein